MKKFFDRYLFSRTGLQIAFSVLVIVLFSVLVTSIRNNVTHREDSDFYGRLSWGFRQITDGGSVSDTLDCLDEVVSQDGKSSMAVVLGVTLVSWLTGLVLYSFVTGTIVNAFEGRRDKIASGAVRYRFKGHGIVLGWNFQGVATVKALFEQWGLKEVLIVSEVSAEEIRAALGQQFSDSEMTKIYIYNCSIRLKENLETLQAEQSKVIFVLGEQDDGNHDAGNMRIAEILMREVIMPKRGMEAEETEGVIRVYIDIAALENVKLWGEYPTLGKRYPKFLDVQIINFFDESVQQLFSSFTRLQYYHTPRAGLTAAYCPLTFRHNPEATHCHLFISGIQDMAKALVLRLAAILPPGSVNHKITICAPDEEAFEVFRQSWHFDALRGVEVEFLPGDICSSENAQRLIKAVQDASASVSVFITDERPDSAMATLNRLPQEVRFENVHFLVEQRTFLNSLPRFVTPYRLSGFSRLSYFGMLDCFLNSIQQKSEVEESLLASQGVDKVSKKTFYVRQSVCSLLEMFQACGCQFEYDSPEDPRKPLTEFSPEKLEDLARCGYFCQVNFKSLCNGAVLPAWERLPSEQKADCSKGIEQVLPILQRLFGNGEYPYKVVKAGFRKIFGFIGEGSGKNLQGLPKMQELMENRVLSGRLLNEAALFSSNLKHSKTPPSAAILISPEDEFAYDLFCVAYRKHALPVIVVLPCAPDEYVERYTSEDGRRLFRQMMRCVYTYVILSGASSREIHDYIASHSDQLLVVNEGDGIAKDVDMADMGPSELPLRKTERRYLLRCVDGQWEIDDPS